MFHKQMPLESKGLLTMKLLLWHLSLSTVLFAANAVDPSLQGMVAIQRGVSPIDVLIAGEEKTCNFVGTVTLGGPFSLSEADKFFNIGSKQLTSFQMMIDYINSYRCGVKIMEEHYSIRLETYNDHSDKDWTSQIASYLVGRSDVDIVMGGYTSGLTEGLSNVANQSGRLLLAPGAAATSVFNDRPLSFGTLPPGGGFTSQAVKALASAGAKTIASIYEDAAFTREVCAAIPGLAAEYGMEVTSTTQVTPNVAVLEEVAKNLTVEDPDVVMTCVYDEGCQNWMQAMKSVDWSPRAQVFTVCVGLQQFADGVGDDSTYVMGVTPWDQSLNVIDKVTGWSAREFAQRFMKVTEDADVTYHAASAASVISIAVQAIEEVNSLDSTLLAQHIAKSVFKTAYGSVSFDANGQSEAHSLLIQYDKEGRVQTVFPEDVSSGPLLYPMPNWAARACMRESGCIDNNNTCTKEGFCECIDPDQDPVGSGGTAQCIPKENMNYFSSGAEKVISFYAALFFVFAFVCLVWTYWYRSNMLVKVSQPACLYLLLLGTIISTSSLLPMSYQTGYRDSSDIRVADASCMMVPWLWGLGFTITFSSLFAKVSRVKKLFNAARAMQRKKIGVEQIIKCMIPMLTINLCILISFQIVSPRQWQRDVLQEIDGFTIESEGYCSSDYGWYFFLALVIFDLASLFVALILCFQTKHIPSDFADSSHIFLAVMFMFQVLTLAVPVCAMVKDDPDAFLFTLATAIFLSNFTVLVIIFGPKMYRIYKGEDTAQSVKKAMSFVADPYGAGAGAKPSWHSLSNGPEAGGAGAKPSWFDESARSSNTPDAGGAKSVKKSISFAENLPRNVDSTTSSNAFDSSRKEKAGKFAVTESDTAGTFQHPQVSSQKEEMMGGALSVES